jgi:hypothetical protein
VASRRDVEVVVVEAAVVGVEVVVVLDVESREQTKSQVFCTKRQAIPLSCPKKRSIYIEHAIPHMRSGHVRLDKTNPKEPIG